MTANVLPFPLNSYEIEILSRSPAKVTLRIAQNHDAADERAAGRWVMLGVAVLCVDGVGVATYNINAMLPPYPIFQIVGALDFNGLPVGDTDFVVHINDLNFEVTGDEARRLAAETFNGVLVFEAHDPIHDDY